ncbi:glycosyltransferase [Patescibacteria group bacterium]|nr:glycosyltransferase [Patescibacteria group bacterium]
MSLKITQAVWSLHRAGAERVVVDLLKEYRARGHEVRLLTACGGGALEEEIKALGIKYILGPETRNRFKTMAFFAHELKRARPDIFHTHLGADLWGGRVATRLRISPWVITAHNDDKREPFLRQAFRGMMFRRADRVVCVSNAVKRYAREEFRVPESRLSIIRNGIDLSILQERPANEFSDVPRILCIGRLTAQKGQDILLRALARHTRPWKLELLGEGPDRSALERLAESLGIAPRVTFAGSVTNIAERLAHADLVCVPSRWEGQSLVLLEAAGSAVPLLVQNLAVFHEVFDEGTLRFVDGATPLAWARAIEDTLDHPTEALMRALHAKERVEHSFTRSRMAEEYLSCYQNLLNEKRV